MTKTRNGQVYGKYIKVKGSRGAALCKAYIDDKKKTELPPPESRMNDTGDDIYSVSAAISYLENDVKVINPENERHLVSGVNCSRENASDEFRMAEEIYHRRKTEKINPGQRANQAFHVILSYKGTDLDPELVHEMGKIFAERVCGNDFQAVVATHLNTGNYHNHILINAYALDGRHKFKDEYNLYRKFREIVNGISSEYGLPVFLNDEKKNEKGYRSWKEMLETGEGTSWLAGIRSDLEECIAVSGSFEEVQSKMREKGYSITHNKRSETYARDGFRVRDRKLGNIYTKSGIEEQISRAEMKEKRRRILEEIEERRKRYRSNTHFSTIYVPVYSGGRRRSFFMRLFILIREAFLQGWNSGYSRHIESVSPQNPIFFSTEKKLKLIDECALLAEETGAFSDEKLNRIISELYAEKTTVSCELKRDSEYIDNTEMIRKAVETYTETITKLKRKGVNPERYVKSFPQSFVMENIAELDPMTKKNRAALYRSLHDSAFVLDRKFTEVSEKSAREIVSFLNSEPARTMSKSTVNCELFNGHTKEKRFLKDTIFQIYNSLPPEIVPAGLRLRFSKKQKEIPPKATPEFDYRGMKNEDIAVIQEALESLNCLSQYGINSAESAARFLHDIEEKEAAIREEEKRLEEIRSSLKKAHRLSFLVGLIQKPGFMFGPLYTGSTEPFLESLAALKSETDTEETLADLQDQLEQMSSRREEVFSPDDPPDPAELRILNELSKYFPELRGTRPTAGAVHKRLEDIKRGRMIEKAISRSGSAEIEGGRVYR